VVLIFYSYLHPSNSIPYKLGHSHRPTRQLSSAHLYKADNSWHVLGRLFKMKNCLQLPLQVNAKVFSYNILHITCGCIFIGRKSIFCHIYCRLIVLFIYPGHKASQTCWDYKRVECNCDNILYLYLPQGTTLSHDAALPSHSGSYIPSVFESPARPGFPSPFMGNTSWVVYVFNPIKSKLPVDKNEWIHKE
jgi:hypothetical protein